MELKFAFRNLTKKAIFKSYKNYRIKPVVKRNIDYCIVPEKRIDV